MKFFFSHYSGAGNTFFLIDNRENRFPFSATREVCKKNAIDGLIFLESSSHADYKMRIFNSDGSEAEMCGNGLRCFVKYIQSLGLIQKVYAIETLAGVYKAWMHEENVRVRMCAPSNQKWHLDKNLHFLNTGVPHAVLFVDAVENIDIAKEGPKWRHHPLFAPAGANVNFVALKGKQSIAIRTYERGVEAETLACGTGAVASAIATAFLYAFPSPIVVTVQSQNKLHIFFTSDFTEIEMEGPALLVGQGSFSLNEQFSIIHQHD